MLIPMTLAPGFYAPGTDYSSRGLIATTNECQVTITRA